MFFFLLVARARSVRPSRLPFLRSRCDAALAVLLKVNIDGDSSASFFAGIVGALTVVPVVLPIVMRLYVRMGGFGSGARDLKRVWADAHNA